MFIQRIGTTNYQKQPHFNARMIQLNSDLFISADRIVGLTKKTTGRAERLNNDEYILLLEKGLDDYLIKGSGKEISDIISIAKTTLGKTIDLSKYFVRESN